MSAYEEEPGRKSDNDESGEEPTPAGPRPGRPVVDPQSDSGDEQRLGLPDEETDAEPAPGDPRPRPEIDPQRLGLPDEELEGEPQPADPRPRPEIDPQ